jgi:hypothetical protein
MLSQLTIALKVGGITVLGCIILHAVEVNELEVVIQLGETRNVVLIWMRSNEPRNALVF